MLNLTVFIKYFEKFNIASRLFYSVEYKRNG